MIIPITKEKEVIFVRQYKHGVGEVCIELPAGRIEKGQTPAQAAVLELLEETGIETSEESLTEVLELWTEPSKSTVRVHGYIVTNVEISHNQELEKTERIELVKVPLMELNEFILEKNVRASDTLGLLLFAKLKYPEIFAR